MSNLNLESIVYKRYKQAGVKIIFSHTHTLRKKFEDNMFKIGDTETKISETTWDGLVRVHFRKFYQSKFNRKKVLPFQAGYCSDFKRVE